jgi:hypothetical protein
MRSSILVLVCLFRFSTSVCAQGERENVTNPTKTFVSPSGHAIGAVLSSSNGKGLAYRYWKQKLGFHASFIPVITDERKLYNGGLTLYCKIREYDLGTLFLHAGAEYQYESSDEYLYSPGPTQGGNFLTETNGFNLGFGPGLHVLQGFISLDVFLGYGVYTRHKTSEVPDFVPVKSFNSTITGGVAVFLEL